MVIGIDFLSGPPMPIKDLVAAVDLSPVSGQDDRTNLSLSLDYATRWGPVGLIADRLFVRRLYLGVFRDMLNASKAYVESGVVPKQLALIGSGRKV